MNEPSIAQSITRTQGLPENLSRGQDWFVVTSKAKSFTSKPKKLCTPNPAPLFPQGPCIRQDPQNPTDATTSESVCPERPEKKRKDEKMSRKYKLRGHEKDCSDSQSSSSGSESSSSESDTEVPGTDT